MRKHADIEHRVGQAAENRGNAGYGYRVLIAEDDYEMRRLLAWSLDKKGYQVTECKDGNALMKKLGVASPFENAQTFDLIISDIRMPGSTGIQALKSISKFEDATPMILITAFPDDEIRKRAEQLGALAVFEKPFDINSLVAEVRRILPAGLAGNKLFSDPVFQNNQPLPFPMNITFRHGKSVEAINSFIRDMARGLNSFAEYIEQVHVIVENLSPEAGRRHRYHIGVRVSIRGGKPVVVSHGTGQDDRHENVYHGIRTAFDVARRQLKHALGKRRAKRFIRQKPSMQETVDDLE
jgi:CheY-like chemotaxis protein